MLLKTNKMELSKDFKVKEKSINITKSDITRLNSKIKEEIEQNADTRLKGLASARKNNKMEEFEELER